VCYEQEIQETGASNSSSSICSRSNTLLRLSRLRRSEVTDIEEARVLVLKTLIDLDKVIQLNLWSWSREHELGRLDVARYAIKSVLDDLGEGE